MILSVDDDPTQLEAVRAALEADGHRVETASGGREALALATRAAPELVLSDLRMPEMDGFALRAAYAKAFPTRETPFVFLSSVADGAVVVQGLDLGADDYLTKPVQPEVLRAKVRAILRRKAREVVATFRGELEKLPFVSLLRFCELKGLTGEVEIASRGFDVRIRFSAGTPEFDESAESEDLLSRLYDLSDGTFVIRSRAVSFGEIEGAQAQQPTTAPGPLEMPTGRLSALNLGGRSFQVQTELSSGHVVTVAVLEGKTVLKRSSDVPAAADRASLEQAIRAQHAVVENELREKIGAATQRPAPAAESSRERFYRFFDEGYECYRHGDYVGALALWTQAESADPENMTLKTNIQIVRKKIDERAPYPPR